MKAPLPTILAALVVGSLGFFTEVATERSRKNIPLSFPQDRNKAPLQNRWQFFFAPVSGNFWTITEMPAVGIRQFDTANRKVNQNYSGCYFHNDSDSKESRVVTFWPWGSHMDHVRILWFNAVRFRD